MEDPPPPNPDAYFYVVVYKMLMARFVRSEPNFVGSGQGRGSSEKSCVPGSHLSTPFKDLKLPRADKSVFAHQLQVLKYFLKMRTNKKGTPSIYMIVTRRVDSVAR